MVNYYVNSAFVRCRRDISPRSTRSPAPRSRPCSCRCPPSNRGPSPRCAPRHPCALVDGFSLHANTAVAADDRAALERLARYLLRPFFSADRLTVRPDGRRLATLIPPRRTHTTRFHGVLASAHQWRARVVPTPPPPPVADRASPPTAMTLARRLDWAQLLLRRVFGEQVTRCPRCGDHLRVLAFLTHPDITARILDHLGLASAVPPIAPARAPPDAEALELGFDDV